MHTLAVFHRWDAAADIRLVIPEEQAAYWTMLCRELSCSVPHRIVYGGDTRFRSVGNALEDAPDEGLIAVHDGVRPLVSTDVIAACFAAAEACGAAIPVVPVIESVREIRAGVGRPVDRNRLRIVQTPQVFRADLLRRAYRQPGNAGFTDDASLVEAVCPGTTVRLVDGNRENIKITTPLDLACAALLLAGTATVTGHPEEPAL
jgi:2-C-methyl-D-erythritol 4-phosphate cytidylyltransferase